MRIPGRGATPFSPLMLPVAAVLSASIALSCEERDTKPQAGAAETAAVARSVTTPSAAPTPPPTAAPSPESEEPERVVSGSKAASFIVDELVDVAPAGPASACAGGVVLVTKSDEVKLATLGQLARSTNPAPSPVAGLAIAEGQLAPLARGPAVVANRAYWVSKNRLVRAPIVGGPIEVLAADARSYTRVVAATPAYSGPAAVAYLALRPDDPSTLVARLWVEGRGSVDLSPEGSGASSVALAASESGLLALVFEGRTGMTPLHARGIQLTQGAPRVGEDVVVWVGGSAQALSEVHGIGDADHAWAFLGMERDVTHFGLAKIRVESPPKTGSEVSWRNYPNGLDPAPMAVDRVCGKPLLLYVRPASEEPHAPQELCASPVDADVFGATAVLARGRAFSDVSIAALPGGALVSYTADRRTWAMTLRCRG